MSKLEELKKKLREIFQLDQTDLDFGIYRIMNEKSAEVTDFLDNKLIPQVRDCFKELASGDKSNVQKELDEAIAQAKSLGANPDDLPKVKELKAQLGDSVDLSLLENNVYSHLISFFSRYYQGGDFMSLRRYKKDVYAIPYEGEEVKLHWANSDQYYIKTSENFKDYSFFIGEGEDKKTVHFKLVEAETEKDNNKADKERRFMLVDETPVYIEDGELYIKFEYKVDENKKDQKVHNTSTIERLLPELNKEDYSDFKGLLELSPTDKNKTRTLLEKHLTDYTAKNSFDYFIHKDLGGFLNRELDFYIKNEVLNLDDLDEKNIQKNVGKAKAIKEIAKKLITFLAQLEDFQKKLWLKKKFVVETNYCITLDKIDERFYPEIVNNKDQIAEWEKLFVISEIKTDLTKLGGSVILSESEESQKIEFLKQNPYLQVDTKFFSTEFKYKLLSTIDNLDEQTNGVLINSDNFHALNLLQEKYKEKINCIYIDPPYNTGNDDNFVYRDTYKHSCWLSLLFTRISMSKNLLSSNGAFFSQIDYLEQDYLKVLLDSIFGREKSFPKVSLKTATPAGFKVVNPGPVNVSESILMYANQDKVLNSLYTVSDYQSDYRQIILNKNDNCENWIIKNLKDIAIEKCNYDEIKKMCGAGVANIVLEKEKAKLAITEAESVFATYGPDKPSPRLQNGIKISKEQKDKVIKVERDDGGYHYLLNGRLMAFYSSKLKNIDGILTPTKRLTDFWDDISWDSISNEGNVTLKKGKKPLALLKRINSLIGNKNNYILDFFAGSGTTGHAAIELNREDNGNRKYILVEMGKYFNTLTKPRIQYSIYSKNWTKGKPVNRDGISQIFKYMSLESYEDACNNLKQKTMQTSLTDSLDEQYKLNYMFDFEYADSLLNIEMFENPFDYKMKITEGNETKERNIDLIETFNYLIGLNVSSIYQKDGFMLVEGTNREEENILVIWRNTKEKSNSDLDEFLKKRRISTQDFEFKKIYVNGDNNLQNQEAEENEFKVSLIEEEFKKRMFNI